MQIKHEVEQANKRIKIFRKVKMFLNYKQFKCILAS